MGGGRHVLQFFWQGDSLKVQTFHVLGCLKETGRISPFPLTGVTSYQEAAAACAGGGAAAAPASPARLSPATLPSAAFSIPAAPSPSGAALLLQESCFVLRKTKPKMNSAAHFPDFPRSRLLCSLVRRGTRGVCVAAGVGRRSWAWAGPCKIRQMRNFIGEVDYDTVSLGFLVLHSCGSQC